MKTVFFVLILSGPSLLLAANDFDEQIKNMPCVSEAKSTIGLKLQKHDWVPSLISVPGLPLMNGVTFRDTREEKSYQLWLETSRSVYMVSDLKLQSETLYSWDSQKACAMKSLTRQMHSAILPNAQGFTDKNLKELMKDHAWGLIYVWSPAMPLSVDALKEVKNAAVAKGAHLTVLMDSNSNVADTEEFVRRGSIQSAELMKVASSELFAREVGLHYPVLFMYKDRFLSNRNYVGHKRSDIYEKWIDLELSRIKADLN